MTCRYPTSWKDLQDLVARYFSEAGYITKTPHTVQTVRGCVEFDVFINAPDELAKTIACECKLWNTSVPKAVVHTFRSEVTDAGIAQGIIISKMGFQSGAIDAARCSNVLLVDWDGFIDIVKDKWIYNEIKRIRKKSQPLSVYTDPMDVPGEQLSEKQKDEYLSGINDNWEIRYRCMLLKLNTLLDPSFSVMDYCDADCIEHYLGYLESEIDHAIAYYQDFFRGIEIPDWKFEFGDDSIFDILGYG